MNAERMRNAARIITQTYSKGYDVVAVVSAQGDTTDDLIEKANELNPKASKREMDMLLSSGEQMSAALLAMTIEEMGFPVRSMTGWQAGFLTNSRHGNAKIKRINKDRIENEISKRTIIIVAGFQGISRFDDITTLGRGGSDTTAVALAAALHAERCEIYTDVDGVYTADPRIVKSAVKLDEISYDEMLELASLGAQVLHHRSVEMAKRYNVNLEVLSSLEDKKGTVIKEVADVEKMMIRGVARDNNVARVSITELADTPGIAFKVFSLLAAKGINVDIILQSIGRRDTKDISFTISDTDSAYCVDILNKNKDRLGFNELTCDSNIAKVSIVGAGMATNSGVASRMFEALAEANVNIQMISTSEIKISVLIEKSASERAMIAIHDAFFTDIG